MYTDILAGRRERFFDDLQFMLQSWTAEANHQKVRRTPQQVKKHVLESARVRHTISELCNSSGIDQGEVWKEAEEIVNEMSHNYTMGHIRGFGYILSKLGKKFYSGVYVNTDGIEQLRSVTDHPIILLPSHRSYVDFQIISLVCYHYRLPLPIIAAGMDFLSMKFVADRMRGAGAFFMRRSFGGDKLYWALFSEYVQTQSLSLEAPVEFFIEGTRSRTGKSLCPKYGLLSITTEPYFSGRVSDIMIVPITTSYDRTLEENLYSYELLGANKPKETTSGLMKALSVMDESYGTLHMHISKPISLREFVQGRIPRNFHSLGPHHVQKLAPEETKIIEELGYRIVKEQQQHEVITPFVLIAVCLKTCLSKVNPITFTHLLEETAFLKCTFEQLGVCIDQTSDQQTWEERLRTALWTHRSLVSLDLDDFVHVAKATVVESTARQELKGYKFTSATLSEALPQLTLQHYTNKSLHFIIPMAILYASIRNKEDTMKTNHLLNNFTFLCRLLSNDFMFEASKTKEEFHMALVDAVKFEIIKREEDQWTAGSNVKLATILEQLLNPFLIGYRVLCWYLQTSHGSIKDNEILKQTQWLLEGLVNEDLLPVTTYSALSFDLLKNAISSFVTMGAVTSAKWDNKIRFQPVQDVANNIGDQINLFINWPVPWSTLRINLSKTNGQAKL